MHGHSINRASRAVKFLLVFAFTACNGAATSVTPPATASIDLANPPEAVSAHGVVRLTLSAVIDPSTGGPALEYEGKFVPPTIRVSPGDKIDLTYVNGLPSRAKGPMNAANLHFHGLSTNPHDPADDPFVSAMPGQTLHYVVPVPKTQPPGLYWYHSHAHGESSWQVYNGMSGAIVINGTAWFAKATAGLPERVVVLRNVLSHPTYPLPALAARRGASPCTRPFDIPGEYTTVNDQRAGTRIAVQPGRAQFWRVLNASADGYYDVSIDGAKLRIISRDGVPLAAYAGARAHDVGDVVVPPASRVEFVVLGARPGAAFRTACVDTGRSGDPNPSQVLATLVAGKPAVPAVPAPGSTPPAFGTYEEPIGKTFARQRTVFFSENSTQTAFYLNGKRYDPSGPPMFVAQSGTVERWTLLNFSTEVHVFHIHQVHFVIADIDGVGKSPVWWDTVTLPPAHAGGKPSVTHVLIDFRDPSIRGTFLFHCHIMSHEDLGMMAKIQVR